MALWAVTRWAPSRSSKGARGAPPGLPAELWAEELCGGVRCGAGAANPADQRGQLLQGPAVGDPGLCHGQGCAPQAVQPRAALARLCWVLSAAGCAACKRICCRAACLTGRLRAWALPALSALPARTALCCRAESGALGARRAHPGGRRDLAHAPPRDRARAAPPVHRVHGGHVWRQRAARRAHAAGGPPGAARGRARPRNQNRRPWQCRGTHAGLAAGAGRGAGAMGWSWGLWAGAMGYGLGPWAGRHAPRDSTACPSAAVARAQEGRAVEMENFFSRLTLDIIGRAVFNYDFDSLTTDDPVIQVPPGRPPAGCPARAAPISTRRRQPGAHAVAGAAGSAAACRPAWRVGFGDSPQSAVPRAAGRRCTRCCARRSTAARTRCRTGTWRRCAGRCRASAAAPPRWRSSTRRSTRSSPSASAWCAARPGLVLLMRAAARYGPPGRGR